ncbi:MAG TPA: hypothetical protein DDZ21_06305 [Gammaproteobacteria bacterium]|nr:hypothetical protein [Gammaproteobacteria bacterium]
MELPDDAVHIWVVNQADVYASELERLALDWLQVAEQRRYQRLGFDHHRRQLLLGKWLTRTCLSEYVDRDPAAWEIQTSAHGKPELVTKQLDRPLCFNLSHSADCMVLAVCRHPQLGVDLENASRERRVGKIADRFFAPTEANALLALPEAQQLERFYDLWTLKEAYIKARGLGLAIALDSFAFSFEDSKISLAEYEIPSAERLPWQIWQLLIDSPFKLALAVQPVNPGKISELRCFQRTGLTDKHEQAISVLRQN